MSLWPAALGLRAWSSIRERGRGRAHAQAGVHEIAAFDTRHDALWERVSRDLVCAVVRDASYLNWKYVDQPGQTFVRLELTERNALLGSAVLMIREPDAAYAYRRAFLVDLVAPMTDESVLDALLQGVNNAYLKMKLNQENDRPESEYFYPRTDAGPFLERGILAIGFTSGNHSRYHLPSDEIKFLDPKKMETTARTIFVSAWMLADAKERVRIDRSIPPGVLRYPQMP